MFKKKKKNVIPFKSSKLVIFPGLRPPNGTQWYEWSQGTGSGSSRVFSHAGAHAELRHSVPQPCICGTEMEWIPEASQHRPLLSQGRTTVGTGARGGMPRAGCCHVGPARFPPLLTRVRKVPGRLRWAGREAPFLGEADANQTSVFVSIIEQTYGLHSLWNNLDHVIRKSNCSEKKQMGKAPFLA